MNLKLLLAAVVVVGAGVGAVVVVGDLLPGGNSETDSEPFPTATPDSGETTSDSDGTATPTTDGASTATPPFGFVIDNIEECGQTCRDVTSTLSNQQDATAENVTVHTRILAGQGTDGDVVWRGSEDVGTLPVRRRTEDREQRRVDHRRDRGRVGDVHRRTPGRLTDPPGVVGRPPA